MSCRRRAANSWFELGWQSWMLGVEASSVIASRMMKVAAGGEQAEREIRRMISEKTQAGIELRSKLSALGAQAAPEAAVATTLRHYRVKVAANRRRLSRP